MISAILPALGPGEILMTIVRLPFAPNGRVPIPTISHCSGPRAPDLEIVFCPMTYIRVNKGFLVPPPDTEAVTVVRVHGSVPNPNLNQLFAVGRNLTTSRKYWDNYTPIRIHLG